MRPFVFLLGALALASLAFASSAFAADPPAQSVLDEAGNVDMQIRGETSLKFAGQDTACTTLSTGAVRYNKTKKAFEICDGKKWSSPFDDHIIWF